MAGRKRKFPIDYVVPPVISCGEDDEEYVAPNEAQEQHDGQQEPLVRGLMPGDHHEAPENHGANAVLPHESQSAHESTSEEDDVVQVHSGDDVEPQAPVDDLRQAEDGDGDGEQIFLNENGNKVNKFVYKNGPSFCFAPYHR